MKRKILEANIFENIVKTADSYAFRGDQKRVFFFTFDYNENSLPKERDLCRDVTQYWMAFLLINGYVLYLFI